MSLDSPILRLDTASQLPWTKRNGWYWTHVTLGRVGTNLDYWGVKDGQLIKRRETVTKRGLFRDDSIRSLAQLPILLRHPNHKRYLLNREGLKVGQLTGQVARSDDSNELVAEAVIDDQRAIERLDAMLSKGLQPEASPCYDVDDLVRLDDNRLEQIRGPYDHIAAPLQPGEGRGKKAVRLHLDSDGDTDHYVEISTALADESGALYFFGLRSDDDSTTTKDSKDKPMSETLYSCRLDGKEYKTADQTLADAANAADRELTALRTDKADLTKERDTLRSDLKDKNQAIATLTTEKTTAEAARDAAVEDKEKLQTRLDSATSGEEILKLANQLSTVKTKATALVQGAKMPDQQLRADTLKGIKESADLNEIMAIAVSAALPDKASQATDWATTCGKHRADSTEHLIASTSLKTTFDLLEPEQPNSGGNDKQRTDSTSDGENSLLSRLAKGRSQKAAEDSSTRSDAGDGSEIDGGMDEVSRIEKNGVGAK